ncbi:MAG: polysaccharide biosynthesis/export family protein [Prochlorococcus marinus CUG1435]|nr:polysaccharide biosynthesis/export family protein [Prochlorococcus marinus CUG1435]
MKLKFNKKILYIVSFFIYFFIGSINTNLLAKDNKSYDQLVANEENNFDEDLTDKYIIGSGDVLNLLVFGHPDFSSLLNILNDGSVQIPFYGNTNLDGLTLTQAEKKIHKLISKNIISPVISINLVQRRPVRVSVVGEIVRPGLYTIGSSSVPATQNSQRLVLENNIIPKISDVIKQAGGLTVSSDASNILIKRVLPGKEKNYKIARVNLYELIFNGDQNQNLTLFDGDVVIINKAEDTSTSYGKLGNSTLAPDQIAIYVVGEVRKPGKIVMKANSLFNEALIEAGGLLSKTSSKNVSLLRKNNNGTFNSKKIAVDFYKPLSEKNNPMLQNEDTIIVGKKFISKLTEGLGIISAPAKEIMPFFQLNDLINELDD